MGILQHGLTEYHAILSVRRIIPATQGRWLLNIGNGVNPESHNTPVEPEIHEVIYFLSKKRILPIQIRLLLVEHMKVVEIVGIRYPLPGTATEVRTPVVGFLPVDTFLNIEILAVISLRVLHGRLKPRMLIRAMVCHQIHKNADAPLLRLSHQAVEIL